MKLVLHIGTEKTGTTSFQRFCHLNRQALLRQGILYPNQLGGEAHRFLSMYGLSLETADDGVRGMGLTTPKKMQAFYRQVEDRLADQVRAHRRARICVLSSEHLHSRLRMVGQVVRVRNLLAPLFDEIEVYVHLRPQVDVVVSLASTQARVGGAVRRGFFDQATPHNIYYDYDRLVGMWEEVFGAAAIRCVPFTQYPDFRSWISGQIGLRCDGLALPERINEALDVRVMSLINALQGATPPQRIDYRVLDQLPVTEKLQLDLAMARAIQARFTAGNQALADRRAELSSGQLQPDWARYPETGNLSLLETELPFADALASLVAHYNAEIAALRD